MKADTDNTVRTAGSNTGEKSDFELLIIKLRIMYS